MWDLDPKGFFSVKWAYRLGVQLQSSNEASVSNYQRQEHLWKRFWKANVPPKIKIYGWRIHNDILPTLSNLLKRRMNVNPFCFHCRNRIETTSHLFWECKVTKVMWDRFCPLTNVGSFVDRAGWSPADYLGYIWEERGEDPSAEDILVKSLVICWQIWSYHNEIGHNRLNTKTEQLERNIQRYCEEFSKSQRTYLRTAVNSMVE